MCPLRCKTCLGEIMLGDQCEDCHRISIDRAFRRVLEQHGEALERLADM